MKIFGLLRELWPDKTIKELQEERQRIREEKVLTANHKGRLVGLLSYRKRLGTFYVSKLVVSKASRGLGIGTRLLNNAFQRAKKAGCWLLWLNTGIKRKDAIMFYKNYGLHQFMLFTIIFFKIIKK
jgi:GNAT superfamily N-acetyltransferase